MPPITPSDAALAVQEATPCTDGREHPRPWVPQLDENDRECLGLVLLTVREYADDIGVANFHVAPMGELAAALDAAARGINYVPAFTPDELDLIATAMACLASLIEGLGDPGSVKALRAVRLKAATLALRQGGGDRG
jgi:hypothetical protein